MTAIRLTVNGEGVAADVPPRMHLADLLREQLRLTGTHLGCEQGVCGSCTVLLDGVPVRSCIIQAVACDGLEIRSIEGLDDDPITDELRDAFRREHGLQCGFCTAGMLIAAREIILRVPDADQQRIRHELSGNLCRCTGYVGIINAIHSVIERRRGKGVPVERIRSSVKFEKRREEMSARPSSKDATPASTQPVSASRTAPGASAVPRETESAGIGAAAREGWTQFVENFVIQKPPREVWKMLSDFRRVASCLPGAELTEHNDRNIKGRMNVKLGPIRAAFTGSATVELDPATMTGRIRGAGSDSSSGSRTKANAIYKIAPEESVSVSRVVLSVEYNLQGPLAQFSRSGLAQDFGRRLIAEFATNLNASFGSAGSGESHAAELNAGGILWATVKHRLLALLRRITGRQV
ncbi:MAG: 2Fe-2S iron-sulfur cluster binding domain-containing protein [Pseudolabrys sp.]|nr:2Fe-2S iron-sulfur cluster binding domain-containing protein [Pseudolabrys sp.]